MTALPSDVREKRTTYRVAWSATGHVVLSDREIDATLINVSQRGLKMRLASPLQPYEEYTVRFAEARLPMRCQWCVPSRQAEGFLAGGVCLRPSELVNLAREHWSIDLTNTRQHRGAFRLERPCRVILKGDCGNVHACHTRNLSATGARVVSPHPYWEGARVRFNLRVRDSVILDAEVLRSQRDDEGNFDLRLRFDPPPRDQQRALVDAINFMKLIEG